MAGQKPASPEYHPQPQINEKTCSSLKTGKWNRQIPWFQKLQKQVSLFRSCTLCVQGSAQKQDVAEPLCRPPKPHP